MGHLQAMRSVGRAELPGLNEEREENSHGQEQRKRIGESSWAHHLHLTIVRTRRSRSPESECYETLLGIIPRDAQPSVDSRTYHPRASNFERQSSKASSILPAKKAPYVGPRSSKPGSTVHAPE